MIKYYTYDSLEENQNRYALRMVRRLLPSALNLAKHDYKTNEDFCLKFHQFIHNVI